MTRGRSISKAIKVSFLLLFSNLKPAFTLAILPTITGLIGVIGIDTGITFTVPVHVASVTSNLLISLLLILIFAQYYTAWVRFLSTGSYSLWDTLIFNMHKRHLLIFIRIIALNVIIIIFLVPVALGPRIIFHHYEFTVPFLLVVFSLIILLIIAMRFSFTFIAAALDHPYSNSKSWSDTKKQWPQMLISFICLIALFILTQVSLIFICKTFSAFFDIINFYLSHPFLKLTSTSNIFSDLILGSVIFIIYFVTLIASAVSCLLFINMHYYYYYKTNPDLINRARNT